MSVVDYHRKLDAESSDAYKTRTVTEYVPDPGTERLYDFIYNLHSAMNTIGCVHNRVGIDYKQYIVDILTPENKALLLSLLNTNL